MPDFRANPTHLVDLGGISAFLILPTKEWKDFRITSTVARPQLVYYAYVDEIVEFNCIVDGSIFVEPDTTVGYFSTWFIEGPARPVILSNTPVGYDGYSSYRRYAFDTPGHYVLGFRHETRPAGGSGGAVLVHFDILERP